ncbi:M23 family metallopeptidase [Mycetocola tolaasinivorans]|uniref:M23 family metallopeptidase n=2 Tax=Mycetocola tolaasinivorans TaxID=76635 RepID=A0A3L7A5M9_9MICO|nr:M23 family metallopeptidase [Mycetocola tolaasinivorans]
MTPESERVPAASLPSRRALRAAREAATGPAPTMLIEPTLTEPAAAAPISDVASAPVANVASTASSMTQPEPFVSTEPVENVATTRNLAQGTATPAFRVPTFDDVFFAAPAGTARAAAATAAAPTTFSATTAAPQADTAAPTRPRRSPSASATAGPATAPSSRRQATARSARTTKRPLRRAVFSALIVPALIGTAALPSFGLDSSASAAGPTGYSAMQLITGEAKAAQTLTVSAAASVEDLDRGTYETTNGARTGGAHGSLDALAGYSGPSAEGWWRPVPGPITSPYGPRGLICNSVGCSNSFHEGMDFAGASGTPVRSIFSGVVTFVGNAGAFGNRVIVDHGNGEVSVYGHLLAGSFEVKVGENVQAGQILAGVGATGVVSGPHLDLKIEIDGKMTDPAVFLRSKGITSV